MNDSEPVVRSQFPFPVASGVTLRHLVVRLLPVLRAGRLLIDDSTVQMNRTERQTEEVGVEDLPAHGRITLRGGCGFVELAPPGRLLLERRLLQRAGAAEPRFWKRWRRR